MVMTWRTQNIDSKTSPRGDADVIQCPDCDDCYFTTIINLRATKRLKDYGLSLTMSRTF